MNEQRLGSRLQQCNAYRTLLDAGIPLAFGSDCMPLGPLYGLHGAIAHPIASERLTPATAWQLYTHASRAIARGDRTGFSAHAPGPRVDFVVLDRDPLTTSDWQRLRVEATIRGGAVIWSDLQR
jgi:predicted amidohydrolase YtcJ